jgi:hypothetical protein
LLLKSEALFHAVPRHARELDHSADVAQKLLRFVERKSSRIYSISRLWKDRESCNSCYLFNMQQLTNIAQGLAGQEIPETGPELHCKPFFGEMSVIQARINGMRT